MLQTVTNASSTASQSVTPDYNASVRGRAQPSRGRAESRDRLEISSDAQPDSAAQPIREALVARVREQIARDAYLNDHKLDIAIERLRCDLAGG
jgi:hypothetical protein